jgi:protein-disulfide isomerase
VGGVDPRPDQREGDLVTITLRRAHIRLAAVLLLGFVLGYGAATLRDRKLPEGPPVASRGSVSPETPPETLPAAAEPIRVDVAGRPAWGPQRAAVTVVEFTDYQCPFCARHFRETYDQILAANPGRVRYVIRNFPVTTLHPDAQKAAEAAECALDQGKFWEYHKALFERSPKLPLDSLKGIAARLGLNRSKFEGCLDSGKKAPVILHDVQDGQRYGVRGTPTFFINGRIVVGAQPITVFQAAIDRAFQHR